MKNSILVTLVIALALSLIACPPNPEPDPEHTHEYDATWTYDATQHWRECTAHDGAKTDIADHDWGAWQETTAPTTTTEGEATRTCNTCGATETKPIDKLPPTPHQSTITAFDKTITVTGDAAISTADFNTAKGKLQEAMGTLYSAVSGVPGVLKKFTDILDRPGFQIIIKTANDSPDADANKSMTVGINYLLNNDAEQTIPQAISDKVMANAFADPYTPLYTNPATITQGTPNGLAFTGKVTIKTSDQYTAAEWDAVVQKVIAALNRGYGTGSGGNSAVFGDVFNQDYSFDIVVIVLKSASHNIEVKRGEYGKLYLKESSLDTLSANNVKDAVWIMGDGLGGTDGEYHANATPAKDRVFLS